MSEQEYGQVCDGCENVRYPLHRVTVRTNDERLFIAWVCDDCLPAYEEE